MQGELEAGFQQTSFQQCVQSEQSVRDEIKKQWTTFSTADKSHCVALAKTGGESSYTELLTCMEMARDVRKLHEDQQKKSDTSSAPVPEGLPAPVGHRQPTESSTPTLSAAPAPAASSRPPSTNEPPNTGADSTLKELERVKADAQKARASEATVRGKLASAEADLQRVKKELHRTKDEAGLASKEAEQAKADVKDAREAKALAERKLVDAEAAQSAAEERLKASESAGQNQRDIGAWLRGWFGHKPSNQ